MQKKLRNAFGLTLVSSYYGIQDCWKCLKETLQNKKMKMKNLNYLLRRITLHTGQPHGRFAPVQTLSDDRSPFLMLDCRLRQVSKR